MAKNFRNYLVISVLLLLSILAPLFTLEYLFRFIRVFNRKPPYYMSDPQLGWKPIPGIILHDYPGESEDHTSYTIDFTTDQYGMRYGPSDWSVKPSTSSRSILVLGDSFTGDAYASDNQTWFSWLNKDLGLPVYAYGLGGAGTYQELLSAKMLAPIIKPQIVILQTCSNDIDNNNPMKIFSNPVPNQEFRRPYRDVDGKTFYASGIIASIYRFAIGNSQLFAYVDNQLYKKGVQWIPYNDAVTRQKSSDVLRHNRFIDKQITLQLLSDFSTFTNKLNPKPLLFGLICDNTDISWWTTSLKHNGYRVISNHLRALSVAQAANQPVYTVDRAHWNILGNEIVGKSVSRELKQYLVNAEIDTHE